MKRKFFLGALCFACTIAFCFAWQPPHKNPKHVLGGFFTIYGQEGDAWFPPSYYPDDVKKDVNVWILSFVHAYDKNGSTCANPPESAFWGKNNKPFPDEGAIQPPTGNKVVLAYEQQRWKKSAEPGDTDYCRLKTMVDAAHANNAIALLCLGYSGDLGRIKESKDYDSFAKSVLNLVKLVGADGFDVDCEGGQDADFDEAMALAIKKVFDKAGKEENRKYFLTMDTAWDSCYTKEALKYCDMVLDQTYAADNYNNFVPKYISGDKFVFGASYETGSCKPSDAIEKYENSLMCGGKKANGSLGCFLWKVATDASREYAGIRKYYKPRIHSYPKP